MHETLVQILEKNQMSMEEKIRLNEALDSVVSDLKEILEYNPEIEKYKNLPSEILDLDITIYFPNHIEKTVEELYESVFSLLGTKGYNPKIAYNGAAIQVEDRKTNLEVELVVGKKSSPDYVNLHSFSAYGESESLHVKKEYVKGLRAIIKLCKIWREKNELYTFHKLALEQSIGRGLQGKEEYWHDYGYCLEAVLRDLGKTIVNAHFFDPTSPSNLIIVDGNTREKIRQAAKSTLQHIQDGNFENIF